MLVDIYLLICVTSRRFSKNWGQGNGLDVFGIVGLICRGVKMQGCLKQRAYHGIKDTSNCIHWINATCWIPCSGLYGFDICVKRIYIIRTKIRNIRIIEAAYCCYVNSTKVIFRPIKRLKLIRSWFAESSVQCCQERIFRHYAMFP